MVKNAKTHAFLEVKLKIQPEWTSHSHKTSLALVIAS